MKVYIIRHGEVPHNALKQYNNENEDLTKKGIKQAEELREKIKTIDYDIIIQGIKIYDEIVINKNLKLLKQWCIENKKNLEFIKIKYPNYYCGYGYSYRKSNGDCYCPSRRSRCHPQKYVYCTSG